MANVANEQESLSRHRKLRTILPLVLMTLLAFVASTGTLIFYHYLDDTLFSERNEHFIEISDKITQVIATEIRHYRTIANVAGNLMDDAAPQNTENITETLQQIQLSLDLEEGSIFAFDCNSRFYASDGSSGDWHDAALLSSTAQTQTLISPLDYRMDGATYMLFLKKLNIPGSSITHIAVAVDMAFLQTSFDLDIFHGHSHIYLVTQQGDQLYHHRCPGGFIDEDNLLSAMEHYQFIRGGTLDDLRQALTTLHSAGYEFQYGTEDYFVAAHPIAETDWALLNFVPTEVLGAQSARFMNTAVVYVSVIAIAAVLLIGLLTFIGLKRRGDRLLIAQHQKTNLLLQEAADAANAANAAKSNFLSHMSHDIRTPINGIMGMTDIALKNLDDRRKITDCLKKIEGSSGHLLSLVNDVLDMSRIESGKTRISHEPMDIRQTLENCASIVSGQLQGRDIALVLEFAAFAHPHILGDELHLRQVLINILGNAVKFTPDGGKIWFRASQHSAQQAQTVLHLEIEDTGIGMNPSFLPRIFEPFAQEDNGTRSNYKGTGLGLAITKQFVDLMGGTIQVESELQHGTRFILELPMAINPNAPEDEQEDAHIANLSGTRLLLAEDNELNMEIALYLLESAGIEVTAVTNGEQAVAAFTASPPGSFDGILMDVMMPVMDGLAATRAIRALEREDAASIPIIAMTANAYEEDRRQCIAAGMDAHAAKPVSETAIFQVLSQYIKKHNNPQT